MKQLANIISTIGNPLIIGLFFGFYFHFTNEAPETLKNLPLIFAIVVVLPLITFIGYNVLRKNFDDFDVSNRKKRNSVYILLIILLSILTIIIFYWEYPLRALLLSVFLLIHITISYLVNQRIKVSMHTSISFLFAWIFFPINPVIGISLFLFGFINGWSRVLLSRHTPREVFLGFILGNFVGIFYVIAFNYFI